MRVLLDANIFISYLLTHGQEGVNREIIYAAIRGEFTVLLPETLLDEVILKLPQKLYLAERISPAELGTLVEILKEVGEIVPIIKEEIPAVTRDPKDDYLLAYAVVGEADYLVTGDDDLLVLEQAGRVKIVNPGRFAQPVDKTP